VTTSPDPGPLVARTILIDSPGDLVAALPRPGICWVRREEGMVAWGEVARLDTSGTDRITAADAWWRRLTRHAQVHDDVRVRGTGLVAFGSFSFSDASARGGSVIVPEWVVGTRDGVSWLTRISLRNDAATAPAPSLADAFAHRVAPSPLAPIVVGTGDESAWRAAVTSAVEAITAGHIDKVVLARAVAATASAPFDVRSVLGALAHDFPTCWTFHVDGLFGATPELLARVDHGLVTSRVLAGTIRPTGDEVADLAHAAALARSSKDREEHEYAVKSVTQVLEAHCASINVPEQPSVLHLPNVMHLATDVTGVLSHNASALELVRELHPSAAVCGTPTLAAARVIEALEDIDRGRYAGPVGWMDATGDGEWCIALRSAEVSEDALSLRLFAGCGIVAASDPGAEWAESEAKLEPMRHALKA